LGIALDPGELPGRGQVAQLALETLAGNRATRRVEDSDLVVEDQRAEPERAERVLEQDPCRARAAAIDPREPGAQGVLAPAGDEWTRRGSGGRRDPALGQAIENASGRASQRADRVVGERREQRKRGRAMVTRKVPERSFELGRRQRRESLGIGSARR